MSNDTQEVLVAGSQLPESPKEKKFYHSGTLRYTLRGLVKLFLWLLWGDFAFTFFEAIFGRFIPLYLKDLQASNTLIGIMTGSFAGLVNFIFLPGISQWSDSFRSRWGRRIPFLYVATPLTVAALILVGFAPEIGTWIHSSFIIHLDLGISQSAVILTLLCIFVVAFHFFNMVLCNAYNWLLRDVVPLELMGRFSSWFRIVGTVSSLFFLWSVFPYVISHRREVCTGIGLFYLIIFLFMCSQVKEGEYPPPEKNHDGIFKTFGLYFRDCLSMPLYRNYFINFGLILIATSSIAPFGALFLQDNLGLDMEEMGNVFSWGLGASALLYFPMGWLCDRFAPILVMFFGLCGLVMGSLLGYFLIHDKASYIVYAIAISVPGVACWLGAATTTMRLFPSEKFGQFSSALNVLGFAALIPMNFIAGTLMDFVKSDYRVTFLWSALFYALAIISLGLVYRDWKKYGGPHHYVPPLPR